MIGPAGDRVRVEVFVRVEPATAFEVFTAEIDQWWRRGPQYRITGRDIGTLVLEPRLGGRLYEESPRARHEVGTITAWEPPVRLAFEWRSVTFAAGETTQVEITFTAHDDGTRVVLVHRGWSAIPGDHPVRHGKPVARFIGDLGMWWAGLLRSLGERALERRNAD